MNVIVLAQNFEEYRSGNYHNDLIVALEEMFNVFKYGPGYDGYYELDTAEDVIKKSRFEKVDLVVVSTSWENEDASVENSDPQPTICLSDVSEIKKVFFLNKEYKKLGKKLEYIAKNKFDLVLTVLPKSKYQVWQESTGVKFVQSHFGINLKKFRPLGLERKYDFSFTGALHNTFTDERALVKNHIFYRNIKSNVGLPRILNIKNPIREEYRNYKIYWAEWGKYSVDLRGRSLLPSGDDYVKLMNESKSFLCTKSAEGIFGTRFFELMACKTLIVCPEGDYYGLLVDGVNCLMYKADLADFDDVLEKAVCDNDLRERITNEAYTFSKKQSYNDRLNDMINMLGMDDE